MEWAFNLPTLGAADDLSHYATEPKPGNLTSFFDFSATPPKEAPADDPFLSPAEARLSWRSSHLRPGLTYDTTGRRLVAQLDGVGGSNRWRIDRW